MNTNTQKPTDSSQQTIKTTRRHFLKTTAFAASAFTIVPRHVIAGSGQTSPNEKLNIAGIGVGGMGANNLRQCSAENIVALCDIDQDYAAKTFKTYPNAKIYRDFREMLEKQKDIDAVIIATPDHSHAVIGLTAIRAGKHVYIQKPMAHSVEEVRCLTEAARAHKVVSQMGNQGRSGDGTRQVCEWIWGGVIGTVREIHSGPIDRSGRRALKSSGQRTHRPFRQGWTGIAGLVPRLTARIIPRMCPAPGARGGISAPALLATSAVTCLTLHSGR